MPQWKGRSGFEPCEVRLGSEPCEARLGSDPESKAPPPSWLGSCLPWRLVTTSGCRAEQPKSELLLGYWITRQLGHDILYSIITLLYYGTT